MRGVLIGTDIVKDTDGLYKAIETNTNIGANMDFNRYFDSGSFLNFLNENGIDTVHLILNSKNTTIGGYTEDFTEGEFSNIQSPIRTYMNTFCVANELLYNETFLEDNALTIPVIEDVPNKLIIRISYDSTALIDDTYARDNWEFLKLMYDTEPNSIPKTYINDTELGFDSIGTTLRDNGNHPNYCIKKRFTPADNNVFPKLLKISTLEKLNDIKSNLEIDEYLQEYVYNETELLNNKLKHYRSIDLVYGGNLDTYNFLIQEITNMLEIIPEADFDNTDEVQIWDRLRYVNKYGFTTQELGVKLSADENTKILKPDNQIILVDELNVGDSVKSIDIASLPEWLEVENLITDWTGSTTEVLSNYSVTQSVVEEKTSFPYFGMIYDLELENGSVFSDVPHAMILKQTEISGSTVVKFFQYEKINAGDTLVVWDNLNNEMVLTTVINKKYSIQKLNSYSINIEEVDLFLTLEESSNNRYGLITHNYNYDCYLETCPKGSALGGITTCAGNDSAPCASQSLCYKCNGPGYPPCNVGLKCRGFVPGGGKGNPPNPCGVLSPSTPGGYCNYAKSDRALKKNKKYKYTTPEGLNVYQFEFKKDVVEFEKEYCDRDMNGVWEGLIAQELIGTKWERYIITDPNGWKMLDYNNLPVKLIKIS